MQKYLVDEQANACQTIPSISNMRIYDGVPVKLYFISQNGIYVSEEFGEKRTRGKLKVYPLN